MLLRVSRIRGIRFADIVGVDHLLARLVLDGDNTKLASGITQLLMASFMPQVSRVARMSNERQCLTLNPLGVSVWMCSATSQGKPGSQQLTRALDFLSTSPAAALVFYRHAHAFCTVGNVAKLIILLQKALHHALSSSGTALCVISYAGPTCCAVFLTVFYSCFLLSSFCQAPASP